MARAKTPKGKLDREIEGAMARLQSPVGEHTDAVRLIHREGDNAPPILVYDTAKGAKIELRFDGAEPWVTQAQMAAMFGVDVRTVNEHIRKYLTEGELDNSVIRKFRITAADGKSYETNHYRAHDSILRPRPCADHRRRGRCAGLAQQRRSCAARRAARL